jgi:pimeloyl-ACP methyl ester carboxylesterase
VTEPLIYLPGMMCDARLFAPQIAELGGTVLRITVANNVADLAVSVLAEAPDRFALAGLSMGGIVAMEVLRQAPDRVTPLALLDTNPLAETNAVKALRAPQIAKARAGQLDSVMRNEMKPNYLTNSPDRRRILDQCMDMAQSLGPEIFIRQSIALRDRPDQSDTLRRFEKPALVLCGRDDALCPVTRHELMHALMPHSTLCVIDGAGHLPTLERPAATNIALTHWLKESIK